MHNKNFDQLLVIRGVPQGSVLGPVIYHSYKQLSKLPYGSLWTDDVCRWHSPDLCKQEQRTTRHQLIHCLQHGKTILSDKCPCAQWIKNPTTNHYQGLLKIITRESAQSLGITLDQNLTWWDTFDLGGGGVIWRCGVLQARVISDSMMTQRR